MSAPTAVEFAALLTGRGGQIEGRELGGTVSLIVVSTDEVGAGPRLHQHPYDETFVISAGTAEFTVGSDTLVGRAGQVIVAPPNTPHKFRNVGEGRLEMINIHANDHFVTQWLE